MHLKNIFILFFVLYSTIDTQFSIVNDRWLAAYPDPFIAKETVPALSNTACAIIATKKRWVNLLKYENNICQLSDEKRIPNSDPKHGDNVKSKLSPDDCLLSNGSLIRHGQELEFSNCSMTVCEKSDLIPLAEPKYASSCVSPFTSYNGGCYHYAGTIKKKWCDARRDCWNIGADLLNVYGMTRVEINDLVSHYGAHHSWTGIKKEPSDGGFLYMSTPGQPSLPTSSTLWADGKPDNSGISGCGFVFGTATSINIGLYDYFCVNKQLYLCEIPLV